MSRIVGGRWGGRTLVAPRGASTRPTAEKVRAAIANALVASGAVEGARVLDLYAGTGALGLELASRGAASAVLVEHARDAQRAIRTNIATLGADTVDLVAMDVSGFARMPGAAFDVIVADPPYAEPAERVATVLGELRAADRIGPGADIVIEQSARHGEFGWPDGLTPTRSKRYGDTIVCYGRAS